MFKLTFARLTECLFLILQHSELYTWQNNEWASLYCPHSANPPPKAGYSLRLLKLACPILAFPAMEFHPVLQLTPLPVVRPVAQEEDLSNLSVPESSPALPALEDTAWLFTGS